MPRRSRIYLDGVPLNVVQRGHNRDACFFADDDYGSYPHWLGEALPSALCAPVAGYLSCSPSQKAGGDNIAYLL